MTSFEAGEQTLQVKQVHIHPLYAEGKPDNDMAVVELKQKIVFKKSVLPACLPERDFADSVLMAGDYMGVVTGWKEVSGATDLEGNLMLNHLSYDKLLGCSQRHSGQVSGRVSILWGSHGHEKPFHKLFPHNQPYYHTLMQLYIIHGVGVEDSQNNSKTRGGSTKGFLSSKGRGFFQFSKIRYLTNSVKKKRSVG